MAGLKQIKAKIRSIEKTQKVTKAMEAVSAAKMRKSQNRALSGRAYARAASAVLARVSGARELSKHPLVVAENGADKHLYIVITSDKGLAGALNSGVLRATFADITKRGLSKSQVEVVAVGRKAQDFFTRREFVVSAYFPNTDTIGHSEVQNIVSAAAARRSAGEIDTVRVAYQNFVSTFEQRPTLRTVFPLSLEELQRVVGDIIPAKGAFAEQGKSVEQHAPATYTVEPSEEAVMNVIVPRLASIFVHHALIESQASEHSARMVAMKSASDKAVELSHELTLDYNKARQAAITSEVSEITGGMEAMAA